jgi:hypothetical protein
MEPESLARSAELLGVERLPPGDAQRRSRELESRLGRPVPAAVRALQAYDGLMAAVARPYDAQPGLPHGRLVTTEEMPNAGGDVLWLMSENQGVCAWGVPLGAGDDPPVLVGGELGDEGRSPMRYADGVTAFVASAAWDDRMLSRTPLVEAGTPPLTHEDEAFLAARFGAAITTWGYPCRRNLRFASPTGTGVLLWACSRGTDWMISGPDPAEVEGCVRDLLSRFDLQPAFGAHDDAGIALLDRVRQPGGEA